MNDSLCVVESLDPKGLIAPMTLQAFALFHVIKYFVSGSAKDGSPGIISLPVRPDNHEFQCQNFVITCCCTILVHCRLSLSDGTWFSGSAS